MKTFFKKLGVALVPILAAFVVGLLIRLWFDFSFNTIHPNAFSRELYDCCISAIWYVLVSFTLVCWIFVVLMRWRKKKLIVWHMAELAKSDGKDDNSPNNQGDNNPGDNHKNSDGSASQQQQNPTFEVTISGQKQVWYHTVRFLFCAVIENMICGSVQLDIPNEDEKEFEPFWRDCDAFIYALSVDKFPRKHGMGGGLLLAVENLARMKHCKTVALRWDDRESEPWVLEWYKRKGYEEIRVEGDGHSHFLVKQLEKGDAAPSDKNPDDSNADNANDADE